MKILSTLIISSLFFVGAFQAQFVKNMGQVVDEKGNPRNEVKFTINNTDSKLFFQKNKINYVLYEFYNEETEKSTEAKRKGNFQEAEMLSLRIKQQTVDFLFLNSNENVEVQFLNKQDEFQNYYKGNVSITNVELYEGVLYKNLYENIDVVFKTSNGKIKYDIILHSGAKLSDIKFKYDGVDEIDFNKDKIIFKTKLRNLEENIPISFYEASGEKIDVTYRKYENDIFGFESHFDEIEQTVVIDPTLTWATILERTVSGGASAIRGNIITDANGNFFYQINTYNPDLPIANPGGLVYLDPTYNPASGLDIYFAKFNVNRTLIWSTYLGGTDGSQNNYYDHGLATYGNFFYICGETNSTNFPVVNQGGGAYYVGTAPSGQKGFFSKFDITTGQMLHSTYLNAYGYFGMDVNDVNGNVAITSFNYTWSVAPNVLAKAGAYNQATHAGNSDIFLYEFNNSLVQTWGTFVGGASYEEPMGIQYDYLGNLFMFNRSGGAGTPVVNPGGGAYFDNTFADKYDFWLVRFNTAGAMTWSTYLGGTGLEGLSYSQVTCNSNNEVIFTSTTRSTVMPGVNPGGGAYFQTTPVGLTDGWGGTGTCAGFIMRFNNTGTLLHSTYIGENSTENYIQGQAIGNCSEHYLLFQARAFPTTPLAGSYNVNNAITTQYNYMAIKMNSNFGIDWSSYVHSDSLFMERIHSDLNNGRLYTTGMVRARDYPFLNPGGGAYYDNTFSNAAPSFAYAIMEFNIGEAPVISVSGGGPATICSGQSITLIASGSGTINWWSAASGGTLLNTGTNYTFSPGSTVTVYVESVVGGCASPRAPITVTVNPGPAAPTISSNSPVCVGGTINLFANTIGSATYFWSGPNTFSSSVEDPTIASATSAMAGVYSCYVQVAGCNSTTATTTVTINTPSVAPTSITGTSTICSGGSTTLTLSGGTAGTGATAQWYSGSCGGTAVGTGNSISVSPSSNTTYFVRYEGTCNTTTCASVTVTVNAPSVAPTSITGTSTICSGSSTTLTLSGGTAGTGAVANWYTGPNGTGTFVGTGSSVSVSPTSTTTYYVRYEGTCNNTADASLTVTVNTNSVAPTSITGTSTICSGSSTTLTLSGGTVGTGATAQWFTGSCGGAGSGTGNSITVSPTVTTTYFVRYAGTCNTTTCASVTVTVNNAPATPGTISGTTPICNGTSNTYSITAVGGATSYTWAYTGGGTPTGTGISTNFSPTSSGTLTVTATNSCGTSAAQTLAITVNTAENASFTLSSNTQCQNGTNITATITGISGGTFTATPAGLSLNASTGAINVAASTPNTYTVTYTTPGSCPGSSNTSVTINATQSSAFTLSSGTVCQNGANVTANITGVAGGAFSSTVGLSLNTTTGAINVLASTPNTYNVTYTSPGPCASSTVQSITINASDNAAFSYSGGTFCTSGTNPTPTITGLAGGTFTATPAGLSINASTGAINLATSTVNTYVVTYTTNGTCPNTATANINITNAPSAVIIYTGTPYCSNAGTANVTFGPGAGGGVFSATPAGLSINTSTGAVNLSGSTPNTYTVTNFIAAAGGCAAATETSTITINAAESANFSLSSAAQCQNGTDIAATITGTTGGTFTATPAGLSINASTGAIDVSASTGGTYTVTYTTSGTCSDAQNTSVTITTADNASFTLSSASVCQNGTDVTASISGTVGGTFSSTPTGLSLNTANGAIDVSASTPGTYDVTYTTAGTCPSSSTVVFTISATDDASFTYTGTTFCASGTNPTPTITGLAGGTFTATPAGLSLDASTGEINLATSTINNYVVTYTTNGSCPTTATATINVTNSPSATFTYSSNSICGGSGTASVSFPMGASGGVFSATPAGLSINASTGEIDLTASSPNTYTVTNFIAASGGCATATDNFVVTILPADDASFIFPAVSACQSLATYNPTISGTLGGLFTSSPAGLIINGTTGEVDLENSTVGNYTITYTTSGTCPDTENVSLEVLSSPIAPTVSVDNSVVCAGDPVIISATGSGGVSYSVFSTLTGGTTLGTTPLTVNPTTTTNYYVEAFGSNGCGNIGGRQLVTVTVNPLPTVSAGSDQTICPTESSTLTATGTGSFVWSTTETTASITVAPTITTTYTVTLTDGNSCSNSANVVVTVQSIGGSLTANDDTYTATSGGTSTFDVLDNDVNGGTPNVISGPTNGTSSINTSNQIVYTSNPNFVGSDVITYTICDAFCANICDTAIVTITVSREIVIEVPGGFTPNGDNINDIFVIQGLDQYPNNELTIYNRWGSIVYSAKPYNNDWDGKSTGSGVIMGEYVTTGTYFYVLKLSEDQEPLKGSLEIKFN